MSGFGLFTPLSGLTQQQNNAGNVRQFTGDGTAFLRCPGLVEVEEVRIGAVAIPSSIEQKFRDNANADEYVRANWPMIAVVKDAEGTPILLRSQQSNDGIWQEGALIFVTGKWEAEKPSGKGGKGATAAGTGTEKANGGEGGAGTGTGAEGATGSTPPAGGTGGTPPNP